MNWIEPQEGGSTRRNGSITDPASRGRPVGPKSGTETAAVPVHSSWFRPGVQTAARLALGRGGDKGRGGRCQLTRRQSFCVGRSEAKANQAPCALLPACQSQNPGSGTTSWHAHPQEAEAIKGRTKWQVPSPGPRLWHCSVRINCWMTEWTREPVQGATQEPVMGLWGGSYPLPRKGTRAARHPSDLQLSPGARLMLRNGGRA